MDFDPHDAIDYIYKTAPIFGKAKGQLAELEAYKSSLKAIMMKQSGESSIGGQEREAYASEEYQQLCKGIGEATEQAELLRWRLLSAQMRFDAWRSEQANNRQIDKITK